MSLGQSLKEDGVPGQQAPSDICDRLNTLRVLVGKLDVSKEAAIAYIDSITEMVARLGSAIVDPRPKVHQVHNFEDNLILELVVDIDALILVIDETDVTVLNPWNGGLLVHPHAFVERAVRSRQARAAKKPAPERLVPSGGLASQKANQWAANSPTNNGARPSSVSNRSS